MPATRPRASELASARGVRPCGEGELSLVGQIAGRRILIACRVMIVDILPVKSESGDGDRLSLCEILL